MSHDLRVAEPPAHSAASRFCELVRSWGSALGVEVVITCEVWSAEGGFIVHVDVPPHVESLFEVDDWVEGVRVMDPNGEDVSVAEAVDYFAPVRSGSTRPSVSRYTGRDPSG